MQTKHSCLTYLAWFLIFTHVTSFQTSPAIPTKKSISLENNHALKHSKKMSSTSSTFQRSMSSSSEETKSPVSKDEKTVFESALNLIGSTTSAVVALTFYAVLAYQRDALMVSFFIGAISNGILSKVAKKVLNQARPADLDESSLDLVPSDNGMPSSHAMSLGFIGVFTALELPWATVPIFLYALVSLYYRVKTNLHSVDQVLVGVTFGSINGYLWRSLCYGTNPLEINVMDWVSLRFLDESGLLPWYGLAVPALLGMAIVGSFERRLSRFLKNRSVDEKLE